MTDKPLRIALVSNKCPPDFDGGLEMSAFQVANHLRARGHHVDIITSKYRSTYKGERSDPDWVHRIFRYVEYEGPRRGLLAKFPMKWSFVKRTTVAAENIPALEKFLRGRDRYDVAYCFGLHRIGLATATALSDSWLPILWHVGDVYIVDQLKRWPTQTPFNKIAMHWIARKWHTLEQRIDTRNIAFISSHLREEFLQAGIVPKRSYLIPRGIDFPLVSQLHRETHGPAKLLIACRLHPTKGVHIALEALALVKRRRPELQWELLIAGRKVEREYFDELNATVARERMEKQVRFLGQLTREETLEQMRTATAFLSTSIYEEPFGRTNIEALACGAPLISSQTGAIEEIVGDSDCALLYERESPEGLANCIERVLESPELRRSLAGRGLKRIEEAYTIDAIMALTEDALREVAHTVTP